MPKPIEINTERLYLRQWSVADRELFAQLNSDPRVMEFFPKPLDRLESDALADRIESNIAERGWGLWAAKIRATQEFIGFIGLNIPVVEFPFSPCVEVGWRLSFPHWGKGYATEGAEGALGIGFEIFNFDEIVSFTAIHNRRSRLVMESLCMREEPKTFLHPKIPINHPLSEHCLYKQLRTEFKNKKEK